MAKNKISDLNNHLFAQLERLNDEELTPEQVDNEVKRSKAITAISGQILKSARLELDATRLVSEGAMEMEELPDHFVKRKELQA
jgi:hypothetical protein